MQMLTLPLEAKTDESCRYHAALMHSIHAHLQHSSPPLRRGQHMAAHNFFCAPQETLNTSHYYVNMVQLPLRIGTYSEQIDRANTLLMLEQ